MFPATVGEGSRAARDGESSLLFMRIVGRLPPSRLHRFLNSLNIGADTTRRRLPTSFVSTQVSADRSDKQVFATAHAPFVSLCVPPQCSQVLQRCGHLVAGRLAGTLQGQCRRFVV